MVGQALTMLTHSAQNFVYLPVLTVLIGGKTPLHAAHMRLIADLTLRGNAVRARATSAFTSCLLLPEPSDCMRSILTQNESRLVE
jgi:hypothetical protein